MSMENLRDSQIREQALDPTKSFIVQAPAGSGKTTLLINRYLKLLKQVQHPEEIIAITFTRKAANEMRMRVLSSLDINPRHLRVLTIDALSRSIVAHLPYLSGFGHLSNVASQPLLYYRKAVQNLFLQINTLDDSVRIALEKLLLHLDNRADHLEKLLISMLEKREQWSEHVVPYHQSPHELRKIIETGLKEIALENILQLNQSFPEDLKKEAWTLFQFSNEDFKKAKDFPANRLEDLSIWKSMAAFLLTKNGKFKKTVNKKHGFPSVNELTKAMKKRMLRLLESLSIHPLLEEQLNNILICPPIHYTKQQWEVLDTLLKLLPVVLAQLRLVFSEEQVVDFTERSLAALHALGSELAPTDLALYLDYQIKHILVDEFQDTSLLHFHLLEKLMAGWQEDDGRTLFLVGDPMQSIYRFRQAEVSLFLRAQTQGIGFIKLIPLTLSSNFRSEKNIIKWINQTFEKVFPAKDDIIMGAISYHAVNAVHSSTREKSIYYHAFLKDTEESEEQKIISIIKQYQKENSKATIAVLVQSRSQLTELLPLLRAADIDYQATELELLADNMAIIDLMSLLKAILNLADRLSWLAVLRAPWCGLSLQDLWSIAQASEDTLVWLALKQYQKLNLSEEANLRLKKILPFFDRALNKLGQQPLNVVLKELWLSIGGSLTLETKADALNVLVWFDLVLKIERREDYFSVEHLETEMEKLYADASASSAHVHIMTIHKAKGLEFDHVILPNLQHRFPHEPKKLLQWLERPRLIKGDDLILAPIAAEGEKELINEYLRNLEKEKLYYESQRLFYVAATRAKKTLDLLACLSIKNDKIVMPSSRSFLGVMYEGQGGDRKQKAEGILTLFEDSLLDCRDKFGFYCKVVARREQIVCESILKRLPDQWLQTVEKANKLRKQEKTNLFNLSFSEQNARIVGIILHRAFQIIGEEGIELWSMVRIKAQRDFYLRQLKQQGLEGSQLNGAMDVILNTLENVLKDEKARWILSNKHALIQNEYALSGYLDDRMLNIVIDRTFVDEQNIRWIIDYKTTLQDNKEGYQEQLRKYAQMMKLFDEEHEIKTALYFPRTLEWIEL